MSLVVTNAVDRSSLTICDTKKNCEAGDDQVDAELKPNTLNTLVTAAVATASILVWVVGCSSNAQNKAPQGPMAMPVKVESVSIQPVPVSDNYVATIKSRRSATIMPQVSGNLTQIFVHSGDRVQSGQRLMEIDPRQQQAIVAQQQATEQQALAVYQYNQKDIVRQKSLFTSGITSKQAYQQAEQTYQHLKSDI